jgi:hypothetical protein
LTAGECVWITLQGCFGEADLADDLESGAAAPRSCAMSGTATRLPSNYWSAISRQPIPPRCARYEDDDQKLFQHSIPAAAIEIMAWSVNVLIVSQLPEQIADVDQYSLSMVGESIRIFDGRVGKPTDVSRYRPTSCRSAPACLGRPLSPRRRRRPSSPRISTPGSMVWVPS